MSELAPLPDPAVRRGQRLDAIKMREQHIAWLTAQQRLDVAALVREDRGGLYRRYVADELAIVWKRSPRQCRNRVDNSLVFADFPAVHALIEQGVWLIDHADAALDELVRTGLEHEEQQQVLELVLSRRTGLTPWEVRQAVRTATVVLFPEHTADRANKAETDRDVRTYNDQPGVATLVANGPAHLVAAMMASLDALCWPPAPDDPRTMSQRRFDALLALVCGQIRPDNWQVQVLVDLATIEDRDQLPAEIPGFGPMPAEQARELATQGVLRRVVVDEHGRLVAVEARVHRPDLPVDATTCEVSTTELPETPNPATQSPVAQRPATRPSAQLGNRELLDEASEAPVEVDETTEDEPSDDDLTWYGVNTTPPAEAASLEVEDGVPARTGGRPVYLTKRWSQEGFRQALHRLRTDPVRPLDLSSDRYVVPRALRRHLELRDRTCVFPGCPRLAAKCDKDHLIPWPRGSTSERNLADECDPHHHGKHEYFTLERLPDGAFRWTSPAGLTADRPPRPVLDAHRFRPPGAR